MRLFQSLLFACFSLCCFSLCASQALLTDCLAADSSILLHRPLQLDDQFPLALLHETAEPTVARLLDQGDVITDFQFVLSNTFTRNKGFFKNDAEGAGVQLDVEHGTLPWMQLGASITIINQGGGTFDNFIDEWHRFFGMPRGGRDKSPDNVLRLSALDDDGDRITINSEEFGLSNIRLRGKFSLSPTEIVESLRFSLATFATLPTATSSRFGTAAPDLGLQLLSSFAAKPIDVHAGLGGTIFTDKYSLGYEFEPFQYSGFVGGSYAITEDFSVLLTLSAYSKLIVNIPTFPDHSIYLDVGCRMALSESLAASIFLRENPSHHDGTTDVTAVVGLTAFL